MCCMYSLIENVQRKDINVSVYDSSPSLEVSVLNLLKIDVVQRTRCRYATKPLQVLMFLQQIQAEVVILAIPVYPVFFRNERKNNIRQEKSLVLTVPKIHRMDSSLSSRWQE